MSTVSESPSGLFAARTLGTLGVAGAVYFVVTVVVMHVIQPGSNPLERFASEYASGRMGWLMSLAFLVFGFGILALAIGLYWSLPPGRRAKSAAALIGVMGVGIIGSGVFPADVPREDGTVNLTFSGQMHGFLSLLGFLGLIIGTFLLRGVFSGDPQWQPLARPARWFAWTILLGLAIVVVASEAEILAGLLQRLWLVVILSWLILLGLQLRQIDPTVAGQTDEVTSRTG